MRSIPGLARRPVPTPRDFFPHEAPEARAASPRGCDKAGAEAAGPVRGSRGRRLPARGLRVCGAGAEKPSSSSCQAAGGFPGGGTPLQAQAAIELGVAAVMQARTDQLCIVLGLTQADNTIQSRPRVSPLRSGTGWSRAALAASLPGGPHVDAGL